ncbi:MAG: hypothetical protein KC621_13945, partial [Myxococcales bacterium]|nr:hypothetical protein [Myxococcales bacterium]
STACDDGSFRPEDHCATRVPSDDAEWEELLRLLVERYGDRVKHWGLWNQPNRPAYFAGTRQDWVDHILVPGATMIHTVCNDCRVVGPDLADLRVGVWDEDEGVCSGGDCTFNGWDHSLGRILQDAGQHIDIVSHHKYVDPAQDWWLQTLYGESLLGEQFVHGVRELTDLYAPGKPVWLTELGWQTQPGGTYTESYAATQLTALYAVLPQIHAGTLPASPTPWPEVQALFWYDLHDDPYGTATWGLLDASLEPKAAYDAYEQVITDLGGCEAFAPGTTEPPEHTGEPTVPTDGTTPTPTGDTGTTDTDPPPVQEEEPKGCGCDTPGGTGSLGAVLLLGLALRRRWRGSCSPSSPGA